MRKRLKLVRRNESDCERIRRLASIQLDGELSEFGTRRLDRHLNDCPPCREFATSVTATTNALRRSGPPASPPGAAPSARTPARPGVRWSLVRLDLTPPA